ncbi:hypothetical protein PV10_04346 [Exophiala mesophila]|uniref:GST N-terminal domain-containing protein n=1 Tax=Exophiala mesophila TaxID=212818 RepID=A0A0D1WUY4_EXOME|nr:uncharacterized protein PV10_04346 [Exophiala mesophila]KIV93105.1 hypothetical protein PV10_04346 [Exophiala mesophila]
MSNQAPPKIKLYTNHGCGWSQRVHITLKELDLPYEEVLLDLDKPRPDWFLALNPRGLVPVLEYTPISSGQGSPSATAEVKPFILTESGPIVDFLISLHPSHLSPIPPALASSALHPEAAFRHYQARILVDIYFTKVNPLMFKLVGAATPDATQAVVSSLLNILKAEIEPLVQALISSNDPEAPFYTKSSNLTLAEIMIAPFSLRLLDFANGVIFPTSLKERIKTETEGFYRWTERVRKHPSVGDTWDPDYYVPRIEERLPAAKTKYADA